MDRPGTFHEAARYVGAVIAGGGCRIRRFRLDQRGTRWWWRRIVPAILLPVGSAAFGALVKAYRVWRDRAAWPIWQGAGWFLLTLMLVCLSIPGAAMFAT